MNVNSSSVQSAYQAAYMQQASFSFSASYLEITGNTSTVAAKDDLNISDLAKQLLERSKSLDVFKCIFPDGDVSKQYKSLDEVEGDFNKDFMNFSSMFGSMLSSMGLEGSGLTIGLDGKGGLTVTGEDGTAQKVQSSLGGNSTVVARFAVMAARAALVDARTSVDGFDSAYSEDPVGAITDNIDSLKELLLGFRTVSDSSGMSYGFMREFSASIEYSSTTVSWGAAAAAAETEAA